MNSTVGPIFNEKVAESEVCDKSSGLKKKKKKKMKRVVRLDVDANAVPKRVLRKFVAIT